MKYLRYFVALIFWRIRWEWWRETSPGVDMSLYDGPAFVDKQSRLIAWERKDRAWLAREPKRPARLFGKRGAA